MVNMLRDLEDEAAIEEVSEDSPNLYSPQRLPVNWPASSLLLLVRDHCRMMQKRGSSRNITYRRLGRNVEAVARGVIYESITTQIILRNLLLTTGIPHEITLFLGQRY